MEDWNALWDALSEPLGLPTWLGRTLDAWWDTIQGRAISDVVDAHFLVIVLRTNHFFGRHGDGFRFVETTNDSDFARASVA